MKIPKGIREVIGALEREALLAVACTGDGA